MSHNVTPNTSRVELRKTLTLVPVVMMGLAYMQPMTLFDTFGIVSGMTDGHVPTAYAFALIAILFTALSYGKLVRRYPSAGSAYTYAQKSISPTVGFMVGWSSLLDYLFAPMINILLAKIYFEALVPSIPSWMFVVALVAFMTAFNLRSLKSVANFNTVIVVLQVVLIAVILGMVLGFLIAIVRSTHDKTGKLGFLNVLARIYLTVIRGTPVVVQLLIIYFVIFASANVGKTFVAVLAFGLNSAAYVAEIVRSGIMSVDRGQFEAGSSLGFGYTRTMISIILPQAIRNILPALGNEAIVLLKETSVSGYIALNDLTKGGDTIRSQTYEAFLPLIAVALIYLLMVVGLSALVNRLERRLSNDKRK